MKCLIDSHIHSAFSPDGSEPPEHIIVRAIHNGIAAICFTDHMDFSPGKVSFDWHGHFREYFRVLQTLKTKYRKDIDVVIGLEAGFHPDHCENIRSIIEAFPFEYIINSVHSVQSRDCYYARFFENRTKADAYAEYLETVIKSLSAPYRFDTVGHLGYITRNAPYPDNSLQYSLFENQLDRLLRQIIADHKILEINTSVLNSNDFTMPGLSILLRYFDLGGRNIVFASDAHTLGQIGQHYEAVAELASFIGFEQFIIRKNGKTLSFAL